MEVEDEDNPEPEPLRRNKGKLVVKLVRLKMKEEVESEESEMEETPEPPPVKKPRRLLIRQPLPEPPPKPTPVKKYTCPEPNCGKGFVFPNKLSTHLITVHGRPKPFICKLCDSVFPQRSFLAEHMKGHEGDSRSFICQEPGCGTVFAHYSKCN